MSWIFRLFVTIKNEIVFKYKMAKAMRQGRRIGEKMKRQIAHIKAQGPNSWADQLAPLRQEVIRQKFELGSLCNLQNENAILSALDEFELFIDKSNPCL